MQKAELKREILSLDYRTRKPIPTDLQSKISEENPSSKSNSVINNKKTTTPLADSND